MSKKVLRIKLKQNKAHYRKEESIDNKMTYPLPPFSTVIGAIHAACGYKEYHPMNISIQGEYESMGQEVYRDLCFLNSVRNERGILVKLNSPGIYNESYKVIANVTNKEDVNFIKEKNIKILEPEMFDKYKELKKREEEYNTKIKEISNEIEKIKPEKKKLQEEKKRIANNEGKKSNEYKKACINLEECKKKYSDIKDKKKTVENERDENVSIPLSYYASLTTSLKRYEVLYGVNLILHIDSDEKTLGEIEENIYNLVSLGRSEDFVEVEEIKRIEVTDEDDIIEQYIINREFLEDEESEKKNYILNENSGYVDADALNLGVIDYAFESINIESINVSGTTYLMNKDYKLEGKKRIFEKKRVVYLNGYIINFLKDRNNKTASEYNSYNLGKNIYMDMDGYILNLI